MWDRLLGLPVAFFRQFAAGDLAQRVGCIDAIRQLLSGATISSIMTGIFSMFLFAQLFYYSWQLALVGHGRDCASPWPSRMLAAYSQTAAAPRGDGDRRQDRGARAAAADRHRQAARHRRRGSRVRRVGARVRRDRSGSALRSRQDRERPAGLQLPRSRSWLDRLFYSVDAAAHGAAIGSGDGRCRPATSSRSTAAFGTVPGADAAARRWPRCRVLLGRAARTNARSRCSRRCPEVDATKADPGELSGRIEVEHVSFRYTPTVR